jgi:glycosyltransferase involved in cell wall biosynthesis
MHKEVLLIGMLNSIHTANWIERLAGTNLVIYLFPSRQYRTLHPKIQEQLKNYPNNLKVIKLVPGKISPYLEFLLDTKWFSGIQYLSRKSRLIRTLKKRDFFKIHAIEVQHAGYLLVEVSEKMSIQSDIILTNWGSDIFFFGEIEEHKVKITKVLSLATHYSAECRRDYELASRFGFSGKFLPIIPNSTTFSSYHFDYALKYSGKRDQIIMKCYGSTFGLGSILLEISNEILERNQDLNIYCYSVTPDLYEAANRVANLYPLRFRYSTIENPVSHKQIIDEFFQSMVYMGASKSDGISTSFLEAISTGAFPIQTSTSCANEWVDKGISASVVPPDISSLRRAINDALSQRNQLPQLAYQNLLIAAKNLNFNEIAARTREFYD